MILFKTKTKKIKTYTHKFKKFFINKFKKYKNLIE